MRSAIVLKRRNDVDFKKIVVDLEFTQPKKFEWILSPGRLPIPPHRHRCFWGGKCVLILSRVRRSATEAPSKKDNLSGLPKQLGSSSDFRSWILVEDSGSWRLLSPLRSPLQRDAPIIPHSGTDCKGFKQKRFQFMDVKRVDSCQILLILLIWCDIITIYGKGWWYGLFWENVQQHFWGLVYFCGSRDLGNMSVMYLVVCKGDR